MHQCGLLQAGLAIGTLALSRRAALGQHGGGHAHMPELGVAQLPLVPAMAAQKLLDAPRMISCTGDRTRAREVLALKGL